MRKILISMLSALLFFVTAATAQERRVTGTVTDNQNKPLAGVTVAANNGKTSTQTNNEGKFSFSVPSGARTLTFSYVNFETTTASIGANGVVNANLQIKDNSLDEVVVVGYGSAKKKSDLVGSVATVDAKDVQDRPSANVFDALQGRVAGLQVYTSSGEPSATSSLRINGVGSLTAGTTPLYVLDGIPIASGSVVSLNPEDYESISVLKDASATSIYGSRAANGVILITSKKGKVNSSKIEVSTQYSQSNLIGNTTDFFNTAMNTKQLTDFWVAIGYRTQAQVDALLTSFPNDTKWSDVYYKKNIPAYQANINLSGGGGKTTYYISGSYLKQEGLTFRSDFERYTLRSNVTSAVNKWLSVGMNLVGGFDTRQTNPYGSNSTNRGLLLLAQPFYSPVDATGKEYQLIPGWGRYHPNYLAQNIQSNSDNVQLNPSGYIQISPVKNLIFRTQAGIEAYDYTTTNLQKPSFIGSLNNGNASESYQREVTKTVTNTAEYRFSINGNNNITALAGQEFISDKFKSFNASSTGITDDRLVLLSAGPSNRNVGASQNAYAYLSYFGRLDYDLNKKYYLGLSIRQDQSSRFGRENRTATFWSVGGRWSAKKERFLSDVKWLSDLVVKGSVGTSGNSLIGNYDALALVGTSQYDGQTGFNVSASGNSALSWEKQRVVNVGVNFSLFNRANFEVEYYNKLTTNMLLNVPFPYTSGFANVQSNVGGLINRGFNVTINGDVLRTKRSYLTPYINFNHNQQEIKELFQGRQYYIIPNTGVSWAVGQPVSYFYPIFSGINTQTGLPEWYLPNSNPDLIVNTQTDKSQVTTVFSTAALQQNTGIKRYPPMTGGFGLGGGFDGFFLNVDFSFAQGKYLINNDRYFYENPFQFPGFNQSKTVRDYWKNPGDVTQFPKLGQQFTQFDTRLIEDASFIRLKNLTVGYDLTKAIAKGGSKVVKGAKIYVTGRNLLTFTKYTGPDPEIDTNVTLGANPNTRQVAVGVNLVF